MMKIWVFLGCFLLLLDGVSLDPWTNSLEETVSKLFDDSQMSRNYQDWNKSLANQSIEDPRIWIKISLAVAFGISLTLLLYSLFRVLLTWIYYRQDTAHSETQSPTGDLKLPI